MSIHRPLLRYHGGKYRLAPWIITHIPPHKVYVEPFGGGASVLLRKSRSVSEVYNDRDDDIVNVFRQVRDNGDELRRLLEATPFARSEFKLAHHRSDDPLERARRIIVRSFMGIGTDAIRRESNGFRGDSIRNCAADWSSYADALPAITERMRGVIIENRDWHKVVEAHDSPDTLFYVDPPYVHSTRTSSHGYNFEMTDDDHIELARVLHQVKGKVILSGYPSRLYESLYSDWRRVEKSHVAFFARMRTEVLWMNFDDGGILAI